MKNPDEEKLIDECIESYRRMIMMHRQSIIRLTRQKLIEREPCKECFDYEIINESGRSGEDDK
jgi:hypothetical protein